MTDQVGHDRRPPATREVHDYRASKQQHGARTGAMPREGSGAEVFNLSRLVVQSPFLIGGMTAVPESAATRFVFSTAATPRNAAADPLLCLAAQPPDLRLITRLEHGSGAGSADRTGPCHICWVWCVCFLTGYDEGTGPMGKEDCLVDPFGASGERP